MFSRYNIFSLMSLFLNLSITKFFYNGSRLIRRPFYVRGKQYINFGKNLTTGVGCRVDAFPTQKRVVIKFGDNVQINDYVHIGAIENVTIGNNVLIASKVFITDHNHGSYSGKHQDSPTSIPITRQLYYKPVIIEDNVWIGESVAVLPGTTIGQGSIIGAMSIVTKDIPPNSIAVGSPAKVIKIYDFQKKEWVSV